MSRQTGHVAWAPSAAPESGARAIAEPPVTGDVAVSCPGDTTVRRARLCVMVGLALLLAVVLVVPRMGVELASVPAVTGYMFWHQDIYVLPFVAAVLLLWPARAAASAPSAWFGGGRGAYVLAAALVLVCWAGHYLVFANYSLSRDEAMAQFDTYIFAHGRLAWTFPTPWRPFAEALNQTFVLPLGQHDAWVSAYLPVNAAIRAGIGHLGDVWLAGPLFVALGALSLWGVAKRLWPESPSSRIVALVLYAGSAQIVVTGMTAYAMSAHLGLDMLWLWLFLRGGKAGHAGAIFVGFLATGLHQPLFHPLFVAPFLLEILRGERRWRLLTIYLAAYAAIGLFWLAWPNLMAHGYDTSTDRQRVDFVTRLLTTIQWFDPKAAWTMALNLLRFATWQHLLLLPLLAIGIATTRDNAMARALAIGLFLPVVAMALLLPVQGHGWGYRYVHGVLGNACLLGGYGWRWLETRSLSFRRAFVWTSAVTFAVGLPAHAVMAHRMVAPYADAAVVIAASQADVVIVDDRAGLWAGDLVVNRPDLTNRPVRLAASRLRPDEMAALCRGRTLAFFGYAKLAAVRDLYREAPIAEKPLLRELEAAARQAGCTIIP